MPGPANGRAKHTQGRIGPAFRSAALTLALVPGVLLGVVLAAPLPAAAEEIPFGGDEPRLTIPIMAAPEQDLEAELQEIAPDAEAAVVIPEPVETYAEEAYGTEPERMPEVLKRSPWRRAAPERRQSVRGSGLVMANPQGHGLVNNVWERDERFRISSFDMTVEAPMFPAPWEQETTPARTGGMVFSTNPLADAPERLGLSATYLQGEATEPDPFDTRPRASGDATSLALDSALMDGRLALRGEYAYSRFDPDGAHGRHEAQTDDAYALEARYRAAPVRVGNDEMRLSAGIRTQEVGSDFRSLGNQGLWADRRQDIISSNLSWAGLSVDAELSRATDNIADDPNRPQVHTEELRTWIRYRPSTPRIREGLFGLFNAPRFQFGYTQRDAAHRGDSSRVPWVVDNGGEDLSLSANFNPGDATSWTLAYHTTRYEDRTAADFETESETLRFDMRRPLGDHLTVEPNLQYTENQNLATQVDQISMQAGVRLNFELAGDWRGSLSATRSEQATSDGWADNANTRFGAYVEHELLQQRPHRPGVNMYLNGSWGEYRDQVHPDDDSSDFQLYLGINLSWPGGA